MVCFCPLRNYLWWLYGIVLNLEQCVLKIVTGSDVNSLQSFCPTITVMVSEGVCVSIRVCVAVAQSSLPAPSGVITCA